MTSRRRTHLGFTLTELLTVIGVTTVLAAILIPVLGAARAKANLVMCSNNLRQLAAALRQYGVDHNDYIPADSFPNPGGGQPSGPRWHTALWQSNLRDIIAADPATLEREPTSIFRCPSAAAGTLTADLHTSRLGTDYGLNVLLCYAGGDASHDFAYKTTFAAVRRPATTIMLGDSGGWDGGEQPWAGPIIQGGGDAGYNGGCDRRHRGKWNAAMADGHVENFDRVPSGNSKDPKWNPSL